MNLSRSSMEALRKILGGKFDASVVMDGRRRHLTGDRDVCSDVLVVVCSLEGEETRRENSGDGKRIRVFSGLFGVLASLMSSAGSALEPLLFLPMGSANSSREMSSWTFLLATRSPRSGLRRAALALRSAHCYQLGVRAVPPHRGAPLSACLLIS